MLTGVHQFPDEFLNSYSSELTFPKALNFFTMFHIVTIANIITTDSIRPLGIIRH